MKDVFCTLGLIAIAAGAIGCAHVHSVDSSFANPDTPSGVKVGIGRKEIKPGDKVVVYQQECSLVTMRNGSFENCHPKPIGTALVSELVGDNSAIVEPQSGLVMNGSMTVEKQ